MSATNEYLFRTAVTKSPTVGLTMVNGVTMCAGLPLGMLGTALGDMVRWVATGEPTYTVARILLVCIVGTLWCWLTWVVMREWPGRDE